MSDLIATYRPHMIYAVIVIAVTLGLRYLTQRLFILLVKRLRARFPHQSTRSLEYIRVIFNTLWIVLGLTALSFVFIDEESYASVVVNFKLVAYLGFIAIVTVISAAIANLWFRNNIEYKELHGGDPTNLKFLRYVVVIVVYAVGILFGTLAFPSLRGIAQTVLGGAGVLTLILGVASQEALANLVGGIFIISFKPFKIGDVIEISQSMVGTVVDITLRHTVIRNFDNKMIVIPNSIINKEKLINYDLNDPRCCERIEIGISYDSDVKLAKEILRQECENHPLCIDKRTGLQTKDDQPKVRTALTAYNDSSVTIRGWAWAANFSDAYDMRCAVLESVKRRYEREGIELPYPYRTVVMKQEDGASGESTAPASAPTPSE